MLILNHAPNQTRILDTVNNTNWHKVDINGADAGVTGAKPWPSLDAGAFLQTLTIRSKTSADADGASFEFALNKTAAPSAGQVVDSGVGLTVQGAGNVWNLWVKKTVGTDIIEITGRF